MSIPPFNRPPAPGRSNSSEESSEPTGAPSKKFNLPDTSRKPNRDEREQSKFADLGKQTKQAGKDKESKTSKKSEDSEQLESKLLQEIEEEGRENGEGQSKQQKKEKELKTLQENLAAGIEQPKVYLSQSVYGQVAGVQRTDLSSISDIILKMVNQMLVGTVEGKQVATVELKTQDVPPMFAGSTISILNGTDGMVIKFENFQTPQDQAAALRIMEKNPQALEKLVRNLNSRDITVSQIQVGEHQIALPRTEPSPIQLITPGEAPDQLREQRQDQDERKQGQDQEPEEENK